MDSLEQSLFLSLCGGKISIDAQNDEGFAFSLKKKYFPTVATKMFDNKFLMKEMNGVKNEVGNSVPLVTELQCFSLLLKTRVTTPLPFKHQ